MLIAIIVVSEPDPATFYYVPMPNSDNQLACSSGFKTVKCEGLSTETTDCDEKDCSCEC